MPNDEEEVEFWTAPPDVRYPNTSNAGRYCFQMFLDYHRCTRLFSEGHEPCNYFKKVYTSLCPSEWVEKWTDQIKEGTFPGDLPERQEDAEPSKK